MNRTKFMFKKTEICQKYSKISKTAFTLAEVLITLGIIGVVAAMTLPTLLSNYKLKELQTQFQKTYTELNELSTLFKIKEGISVSEYASINTTNKTMKQLFKYFKSMEMIDSSTFNNKDEEGNVKYSEIEINSMTGQRLRVGPCDDSGFYMDSSGKILSYVGDAVSNGEDGPVVCIDINGYKKPNRYGFDIFVFYFTTDGYVYPMGQTHKNNTTKTSCADHCSSNFYVEGSDHCSKKFSGVKNHVACAYYALADINPEDNNKKYWTDFLKTVK